MSRTFGEIRQIAFVVSGIDASMQYWANMLGIGPFFIKRHITLADFCYRGQRQASPSISIALANSGSLQIELIQQHDDTPSIYREFQHSGQKGLQHVAAWVSRAEFDIRRATLLNEGHVLVQEGTIPSSGVRLAYFDTELDENGLIFELADLKEPAQYQRVMGIAAAASVWDGQAPVIEVAA
jgi:hypothetical protein